MSEEKTPKLKKVSEKWMRLKSLNLAINEIVLLLYKA